MTRVRTAAVLGAVAIVVALAVTAPTGQARAAAPTTALKGHVEQMLQVLQDPALQSPGRATERRARIRKIAGDIFDFGETAKLALGRHWRQRSPAEQQEFVKLFTDLLEHAYISKIETYRGEQVSYSGESVEGDRAMVRSRIVTPKGSEIPIDYRMHRANDRWLVYDVMIEGVSLVANYRRQFDQVIQTSSYPALLDKMRAKAFTAPEGATKERRS